MTAKSKRAPEAGTPAPKPAALSPTEAAAEDREPAAPAPSPEPAATGEPASQLERDLDVYPVREGAADPRWAVRIVWGWTGFTLLCLAFVLALLVLGAFYD